ncbi:MAG: tetratricopeptide repeat protein [Promethearchaeota archaeon]
MENTNHLISSFVKSLETHPNGTELIAIIEDILADDSAVVSSTVISSLMHLSNNNVSLLVDFWILRGSILCEEGRDHDAFRVFIEANQWKPNDPSTWLRIADFFRSHDELLKAVFFLIEARERFESSSCVTNELHQLMSQLEVVLAFPPGYKQPLIEVIEDDVEFLNLSSNVKGSISIPPEATSMWDLALECFEEGMKGDNLIYLNAFIHYAHSTVREILGLDGNFKAGLDRKVAQYGLFDFQPFLNRLNSLRNAVIHDNYLLSKDEAQSIHDQITHFLSSIQQQ